jgi:hypothetical protein
VKRLLFSLLGIAGLASTFSGAQTLPLRLYYTDAEISAMCAKATDISSLSGTHYRQLTDDVSLQTPLGTVFSTCYYYNKRLEPLPGVSTLRVRNYEVIVFLDGVVQEYSDADSVRAVLVTRSGTRETARLQPTRVEVDRESWDPDCSGYQNSCVWRGTNMAYFRVTQDTALYKRLKAGDLLYVLYTLGAGPQPPVKVGALEGTSGAAAEQKLLRAANEASAERARQQAAAKAEQDARARTQQQADAARLKQQEANLRELNTPINASYSYVLLRDFATNFGALLDSNNGNPRLTHEGVSYTFTPNSAKVYTPGTTLTMPVPLFQRQGVTYVPARFFTQIGCIVSPSESHTDAVHIACPSGDVGPLGFDFDRH